MAMIETNFIRPLEVYDRNTGESKVRYRSYDGNNRFIPVLEGENGVPKTMVEVTHAELKAMRDGGKLTAGALYRITDYNCTTTQENTQSAGHQFDIVLLALSANKLAEEGWAMEHPTDVYDVTFADGVTKKCYIYHTMDEDNNSIINVVDIETKLGIHCSYIEGDSGNLVTIDENAKTASTEEYDSIDLTEENLTYNYFQNSNLSAWKVWYCLDNDTARFAWADDSVDEGSPESITLHNNKGDDAVFIRNTEEDTENFYAWTNVDLNMTFWTNTLTPTVEDNVYNQAGGTVSTSWSIISYTPAHEGTNLPNGRGVIYRLIDEFNNDIKYDFKNIQFKRKLTNGQYNANGTETWCYTLNLWYNDLCQDASIVGNTLLNDEGFVNGVYGNDFGYATAYDISIEGVSTFAFALGNNVVLSFYKEGNGYYGIYSNTVGNSFYNNTIGNEFNYNMIGNNFINNIIGILFSNNTIGNVFTNKTISDNTSAKNYGNNGVELATKS